MLFLEIPRPLGGEIKSSCIITATRALPLGAHVPGVAFFPGEIWDIS